MTRREFPVTYVTSWHASGGTERRGNPSNKENVLKYSGNHVKMMAIRPTLASISISPEVRALHSNV